MSALALLRCSPYSKGLTLLILITSAVTRADTVTLDAVGDVMLARGVEKRMRAYGAGYPFSRIKKTLTQADVVVANLECALTTRPFTTRKAYRLKADPTRAAVLRNGGATVVSLANNHSLDCGRGGLADAERALDVRKVRHFGSSRVPSTTLEAKGLKIAFLGYSDFPKDAVPQDGLCYASDDSIAKGISSVRKTADIVIVSFHWGIEGNEEPTPRQRHLARVAAASGADIVLGHHPHVLQGIEVLRGARGNRKTLVAYSLGNFVFDTTKLTERRSIILRCKLGSKGIVSAEIVPVLIRESAPRLATGDSRRSIITRVRNLSEKLGARIDANRVRILASAS